MCYVVERDMTSWLVTRRSNKVITKRSWCNYKQNINNCLTNLALSDDNTLLPVNHVIASLFRLLCSCCCNLWTDEILQKGESSWENNMCMHVFIFTSVIISATAWQSFWWEFLFCTKMAQSYMSTVGQSTMMGHNDNNVIVFQLKD